MYQKLSPKEKLNVFASKKHLVFLTTETHDTTLTNIKILDKNIVPSGGAQAPDCGMKY